MRYTLKFTTFMDDGSSYLSDTVDFDDEYRALEMAENIVKIEKWVNVTVYEHGRRGRNSPRPIFDWRFYNQPEWARHILEGRS